ncbi:hypothetical protein ABPG74_013978 [Tetrahymena malaccensis]
MGDFNQGQKSLYKSIHQKDSFYRSEGNMKKDKEFLEFKRQINKLLLDEEKVEKMEDATESKFYFEKMRCLELCRLTLMVMAQVVAILDYEIEFSNLNFYYAQWFLYLTLICSICLIVMTYFSYDAQNQFIIATKQHGKEATIFNTGQWKYMVLEMSIYLIFPQPWFTDYKVYFFVDYYQMEVYHYLNEILLLVMLLRILIMVKIVLINTQWYTERVNRVCNLYATRMSPLFIVKVNMQMNPMRVFWFCYSVCLFTYSYAIRICERPLLRLGMPDGASIALFNLYEVAIWCMMISIPSVGYGDVFPTTNHGRFIAVLSFISGTFMFSVLCNSLIIILTLDSLESKASLILEKLTVRKDIIDTAVKMFSYVGKIAIRKNLGKVRSLFLARKLRKSALHFKQVNRKYKCLVDRSNLNEQLDKQFTYIGEEVEQIKHQIDTIQETQILITQQNHQKQLESQFISLQIQSQNQKHQEDIQKYKKRKQQSSFQYYTDSMNDQSIKQKPYNFQYNMINHIHPNQFY